MTLHDKSHEAFLRDNTDIFPSIVYLSDDVKEAVKKLKKELCIHGVMYKHEVPCKCMNCECIKEIFGEGLIHSPEVVRGTKGENVGSRVVSNPHRETASSNLVPLDNIQNSEDKKE